MRILLLTMAVLLAMGVDGRVLLWFIALLPLLLTLTFVALLLSHRPPAAPPRVWEQRGRHHGPPEADVEAAPAHTRRSARSQPGRHTPAPGRWSVDRVGRIGEDTVAVDAASILKSLPRPEGMAQVGKVGMWSWDGSTRLGPRPVRPRTAPEPPPPASGRGA